MKFVYFIATVFVLLKVCDCSEEPKCEKGEVLENDCNSCICSDAGLMVCTVRACTVDFTPFPDTAPIVAEPVEEHTEISETNGQVCTPNETKMQNCNRCKCSANGIVWICTRRLCPPTLAPKIPVNEPGFTCIPNQVFKDDCNTCSCDESGTLARCTAMLCDPSERQKRSNVVTTTDLPALQGNKCVPGTHWKQDCNSCFCSDNGFAACTLKGCLGHGHRYHFKPIEKKLTTLEIPTNASDSGSNRVKRENEIKGYGKKPKSTPNPDAQKEPKIVIATIITTTPRLNNYVPTSDKVYTEAQILDPDFKCTPSESFKVECNTCWCAASGNAVRYCTRQACHPKVYPTLAPAQ